MNNTGHTEAVHADPRLDRDLAAWRESAEQMLRVRVLGPVQVEGGGGAARPTRAALLTEAAAYLACHPAGGSYDQLAEDVFRRLPGSVAVRALVGELRSWLGVDSDGEWHVLRPARADSRLVLRGAVVDADLFRRLRLRGLTRGKDGIEDLWAALRLVAGEPFSDSRPLGYRWLHDQGLHLQFTAMIVDVAHVVATHHLAEGEPERAIAAAQVGLLVGIASDAPLLDLLAAYDAQDKRAEADVVIARFLAHHDTEVEEDLPPSIYQAIQHRHPRLRFSRAGWLLRMTRAAKKRARRGRRGHDAVENGG